MKKVLSFLKWQLTQFDLGDVYCLLGVGLALGSLFNQYILLMALAWIIFGICYLIYFSIRTSYNKFQQEQNQLFEKIKNSGN